MQDVWNGIEVEACDKLIRTMPERVRDVLKARGGIYEMVVEIKFIFVEISCLQYVWLWINE